MGDVPGTDNVALDGNQELESVGMLLGSGSIFTSGFGESDVILVAKIALATSEDKVVQSDTFELTGDETLASSNSGIISYMTRVITQSDDRARRRTV